MPETGHVYNPVIRPLKLCLLIFLRKMKEPAHVVRRFVEKRSRDCGSTRVRAPCRRQVFNVLVLSSFLSCDSVNLGQSSCFGCREIILFLDFRECFRTFFREPREIQLFFVLEKGMPHV